MNLNALKVLVINSVWLPIGITSYKKALICLCSENNGLPAAKALDIQYKQIDENNYDFSEVISILPLSFDEWLELPVRSFDGCVKTAHRSIRLPNVIVALQFFKMPMRKPRATKMNILQRDDFTCQYSGVKLPRSKLNVDHYIAKSKGGKDDFSNLVTCSKKINSMNSFVFIKRIQ
ncbi:MAG: HNH endonuclease signature motif containing protein [Nanoarchaeota archaeon]